MSVPNTTTFGLTDVTVEIYGDIAAGRNLRQCFIDATGVFDPNYVGSKDNLLNFRNYSKSTMNILFVAIPAAANPNPYIRTTLIGTSYTTQTALPLSVVGLRELRIARSNKNYMIASYNSASSAPIAYYSSNGGVSWTAVGISNTYMFGSAISDNGAAMIQVKSNTSYALYYSYNFGSSWTTKTTGLGTSQQLRSPSCNSNGSFVWVGNLTSPVNYYSINSCSSFTAVSTPFIVNSTCMHSNGSKVWIASSTTTKIAYTTNKSSFTSISLTPSNTSATYIACSSDGKYILVSNDYYLWVSSNYGASFTTITPIALTDPSSLSVSTSGKYMSISARTIVGVSFTSYNYGVTWASTDFSGMSTRISASAVGE